MLATVTSTLSSRIGGEHAASVAVSLDGITKRFPARRTWTEVLRRPLTPAASATAVESLTLDVHRGEFFGVLGPNGAGKTTLFKMLAASLTPDAGRAFIYGRDIVADARGVRGLVGVVMANDRTLYWRLSALENLRLFGALYGMHGSALRTRIAEMLAVVGLSDAGTKMVANFSSGMRQRLLIARALLPRPRLLLLDEPTRSLDPLSARSFHDFLRSDVAGREGCTVLLATHSSEEAIGLCDRVAILDKGRLLALGTTADIGRRFGDPVFTLVTTAPEHPALAALAASGRIGAVQAESSPDGWSSVRLTIPGGARESAYVLDVLTSGGMPIAAFERVTLGLADLIERVLATSEER